MKKGLFILIVISVSILSAACSNNEQDNNSGGEKADVATDNSVSEEQAQSSESFTGMNDTGNDQDSASSGEKEAAEEMEGEGAQSNRKVIYTANLRIEVTDYQKTVTDIQNQVADRGGYIVESSMQEGSADTATNGQITARIPQDHFRDFIQIVEEDSSNVLNSSVSGEDVTEEYIDLESRLESKQVVEERLNSFMEQAEKTEDLLAVSEDLAQVQEEIEQITGRMNYLENKSDLATITIQIEEKNVTIAGMNEDDLNTWEKTKQQFMASINFLISAFSGLVVFFIGNLPVLIIMGAVGLVALWLIRKRKKTKQEES